MRVFKLKYGQEVLVDEEDVPFISQFDWKISKNGYVYATVYMHRLIARTAQGLHTDHIDRNRTNNCKSNLRSVTCAENQKNRGPRTKQSKRKISGRGTPVSSKFQGVSRSGKRWRATLYTNKRHIHVGCFGTEEEANAARLRVAAQSNSS